MMTAAKYLLVFVLTALANGGAFWLAAEVTGMFPTGEGIGAVALIGGSIWVLMGLCFRKEPFALFLCIGPIVPMLYVLLIVFNPFAWTFDITEWTIKVGTGFISAAATWAILNIRVKRREVRGFPVIGADNQEN